MNEIIVTNLFFDPKFLDSDFTPQFALAVKYRQEFKHVLEYEVCGDVKNPNSIPKELQIFNNIKIVHMYTFLMDQTLDWHRDLMRLDAISSGKYIALIYGSGRFEVQNTEESTIESQEFNINNKFKYYKFNPASMHRFIPYEKTKMLVANTLPEHIEFSTDLYRGTKSTESYPELENIEEKIRLKEDIKNWHKSLK